MLRINCHWVLKCRVDGVVNFYRGLDLLESRKVWKVGRTSDHFCFIYEVGRVILFHSSVLNLQGGDDFSV